MTSPISTIQKNLSEVKTALEEIEGRLYINSMPCDESSCPRDNSKCCLFDPEHGCLQDLCRHIINNWGKY